MTSTVFDDEWTMVLSEIIQSATSLFLNGICILLAVQACYFLRRRGSSGSGVLICAMILFCGLAIAQMIHQVVVTAMLLRLHHSAWTIETVSERQRLQATFQRLSEVKEQ
ncbi:hypothetical protein K438DRAFT_1851816, partial [Mycena galopus ATCC 62051]